MKTNQEKAKEIAHDYFRRGQLGFVSPDTESAGYDCAIKMAQWKDEEIVRIINFITPYLPENVLEEVWSIYKKVKKC